MMMLLLFRATRPVVLPVRVLSTTDLSQHRLNCGKALKKADEGHSFSSLSKDEVSILQGIGPERLEALHSLGIKTIPELAKYKCYHTARAIVALSMTEEDRLAPSVMNINKALDKAYETKSLVELVDAPVAALQGISDAKQETFHKLGVETIGDLAKWKYCHWAESIVWLSKFEE
jgi:predicted flap endonuclease-1-like 5' DNA nuclease